MLIHIKTINPVEVFHKQPLFRKWADEFTAANPDVSKITMVGKNDADDMVTGLMAGVCLPD
jgi:hypothetical protein